MTPEEIKREQRKQRRLEALGTNKPICTCGETHWACFDVHHPAGQEFDKNAKVPTCCNCHRKLTIDQKDHPAFRSEDADPLEAALHRLIRMALGVADMLRLAADHLVAAATALAHYLEQS